MTEKTEPSNLSPTEIDSLPWIDGLEYDTVPLPNHSIETPDFSRALLLGVGLTLTLTVVFGAMSTIVTGSPIDGIIFACIIGAMISVFGMSHVHTFGFPDRTSAYSPFSFGSVETTYKKVTRAGMPLITMRIVKEGDLMECVNCGAELEDAIEVVHTRDFVVFGVPFKQLERASAIYCGECIGYEPGEEHQGVVIPDKPSS